MIHHPALTPPSMHRTATCLLLLLAAGSALAAEVTPSFNCAKATLPAEQVICRSGDLALYDRNLAYVYRKSLAAAAGAARADLQRGQQAWLRQRNACGADTDCLLSEYDGRITYLLQWTMPDEMPTAVSFPHKARSFGGALREGPGMGHGRVGGLAPGAPITLFNNAGVSMNGYDWFRVGHAGGTAFQWGGLICAVGDPVPGTFRTCD